MLNSLLRLRKFYRNQRLSDSDTAPAKAPRTLSSEFCVSSFAALVSLQEINRVWAAALPHCALRGEHVIYFSTASANFAPGNQELLHLSSVKF
jgi:hypothetical protein